MKRMLINSRHAVKTTYMDDIRISAADGLELRGILLIYIGSKYG